MKDNVIRSKSFQFAVDAVNMYKEIQQKKHEIFRFECSTLSGLSVLLHLFPWVFTHGY
jgi:hypothetical protein